MHIKHVLNFCLSHPQGDIYANMNLYKTMHFNMFSNSQHFESKFRCIPLGTTQDLLELVFPFFSRSSFCPFNIFFSKTPWLHYFSHLWGPICPVNQLNGNLKFFYVYHVYFELWLYKIKVQAKYLPSVFLYQI